MRLYSSWEASTRTLVRKGEGVIKIVMIVMVIAMSGEASYHIDNGEGLDNFHVGASML